MWETSTVMRHFNEDRRVKKTKEKEEGKRRVVDVYIS